MSTLSYILLFTCTFLMAVQGLQISFNSVQSDMLIRDTAQAHYESIIDDILSQHNEGLLTELSIVIKNPHDMQAALRPQSELLMGSPNIQDVCVAQMPGMIANQIHELSNEIYSSVDAIVSELWTTADIEYRQIILNAINKGHWEQEVMDELVASLELLNMDIADRVIAAVDRFDILYKVKLALKSCQSIFDQENNPFAAEDQEEETLTEKIWTAILVSFTSKSGQESIKQEPQHGFLNRYIFELTSDLQSELYSRVFELAKGVYEDLAFIRA
ncbi:hypothetical protein BD408DRAFT_426125 [Parasitella parasitica]|nr:hypothetical protein BD408DRAFT_426125 [Parasitella parasitica]